MVQARFLSPVVRPLSVRLRRPLQSLCLIGALFLVPLPCVAASVPGEPARTATAADESDCLRLKILHTNDTHAYVMGMDRRGNAGFDAAQTAGGYGRIAAFVRKAKAGQDNVLALDAGDFFQGSLYYSVFREQILADVVPRIPYDAVTLGNHEWDEGCATAAAWVKALPFPVLAANLRPGPACPLSGVPIPGFVIRQVGAVPVGIIGLAHNERGSLRACPDTHFADTLECVGEAVAALEAQGVRHIILLTHLGYDVDQEIARAVDGVDIIVGGHTHTYLANTGAHAADRPDGPYPTVVRSPAGNPVLVVTAKRATRYLGELDVVFSVEGIPVSWSGGPRELVPDTFPFAPDVAEIVAPYTEELFALRSTRVGSQHLQLPDGLDWCRVDDCLGGLVFTDALLAWTRRDGAKGEQVALINGGGIWAALPVGDISLSDLLAVFPFGNNVQLLQISGRQLREALENGLAEERGLGPHLLQVAGLTYEVDGTKPAGSRVGRVQVQEEDGTFQPLEPDRNYRVALIDFLAKGNDGFASLQQGERLPFAEALDVDVVRWWLGEQDPVRIEQADRIVRLDAAQIGLGPGR